MLRLEDQDVGVAKGLREEFVPDLESVRQLEKLVVHRGAEHLVDRVGVLLVPFITTKRLLNDPRLERQKLEGNDRVPVLLHVDLQQRGLLNILEGLLFLLYFQLLAVLLEGLHLANVLFEVDYVGDVELFVSHDGRVGHLPGLLDFEVFWDAQEALGDGFLICWLEVPSLVELRLLEPLGRGLFLELERLVWLEHALDHLALG